MTAGTPASISRILVVKLSSLGDILHALPAVHNLRVATGATVDWVVQSEYADFVRAFDGVTRVIATQRRAFIQNIPALRRELRRERYDLVIDLQGLLKSAIVARLARGGRRIGPSYHREGARVLYGEVAGAADLSRHAVVQALDIVRHLGLQPVPPAFPLRLPTVPPLGPGVHVALAPMSRWESKNWPVGHFAALTKRLLEDSRVQVHVLGSAGEADVCARLAAGLDPTRVHNRAGQLNLLELGAVLKSMDLLIANDTGPVHMAAAVGTRCLVLFGPTDPARHGPFGAGHRTLRAPPPCAPCYDRACRRHGEPCLSRLLPDTVLEAAREMLTVLS